MEKDEATPCLPVCHVSVTVVCGGGCPTKRRGPNRTPDAPIGTSRTPRICSLLGFVRVLNFTPMAQIPKSQAQKAPSGVTEWVCRRARGEIVNVLEDVDRRGLDRPRELLGEPTPTEQW